MTAEGFHDSKDKFMDGLTEAFGGDSGSGTVRLSFKRGLLNRQLPGRTKVPQGKGQTKGAQRGEFGASE